MKILVDFLMLIAFFVAYKWSNDMIFAVKVAIAAAAVQLLVMKVLNKPILPIHWFSFISLVFFGGVGIFFKDPKFFQWKFSVIEWLMGAAILIGHLGFKKNVLQLFFGQELVLPQHAWNSLAWMWSGFFIALGLINWWVFSVYSYDVWVNFKTFWAFGLTVGFMLLQGLWLSRYLGEKHE